MRCAVLTLRCSGVVGADAGGRGGSRLMWGLWLYAATPSPKGFGDPAWKTLEYPLISQI